MDTSKSKKLIKAQKEWYKILKDEGFQEIEYMDTNCSPKTWLRGAHNQVCTWGDEQTSTNTALDAYNATEEYYQQATARGRDPSNFVSLEEEELWKMHAEGLSLRESSEYSRYGYRKIGRILVNIKLRNGWNV